jgi:hypothetical protein
MITGRSDIELQDLSCRGFAGPKNMIKHFQDTWSQETVVRSVTGGPYEPESPHYRGSRFYRF